MEADTKKLSAGHARFWQKHPLLGRLAAYAPSLAVLAALVCTLLAKLYVALRNGCPGEYFHWIATDLAVLLAIELALVAACWLRPGKWVFRICVLLAALVCAWSVINAGWMTDRGTQILPSVLLPLLRDPINNLAIVAMNLIYRPAVIALLIVPGVLALLFICAVLAWPVWRRPIPARIGGRLVLCTIFIPTALLVRARAGTQVYGSAASNEMRYNCQLAAARSLLSIGSQDGSQIDLSRAERQVPRFDEVTIRPLPDAPQQPCNIVTVVLEGVGARAANLSGNDTPMPYLASQTRNGVTLTDAHCPATHTTKSLFSLMTGRYPSPSQDVIEAVPAEKPYASLATILKSQAHYRTAFFQSAKGNFECRPSLVSNLGFDKFWSRDELPDEDDYVGYLGCDEYAMIDPICRWIQSGDEPFFLTVLCSVTHDPYEIPDRFGEPADEPEQRFHQAVAYTDGFLKELDQRITNLSASRSLRPTIFCVVGDHGEAFGEHNLYGHARIPFEEVLRIVWVMRAPGLIEPGRRVHRPVSSIDFAPTLLQLLGLEITNPPPDGTNVLTAHSDTDTDANNDPRKLYFSCWLRDGPIGFVWDGQKIVYDPMNELVVQYDLTADPNETSPRRLQQNSAQTLAQDIINWQQSNIIALPGSDHGRVERFGRWICTWNQRKARAKYTPAELAAE